MKWLIIAVIVLAQQPTKSPEVKNAPKSVVAKDSQQTDATKEQEANPCTLPPSCVQQQAATQQDAHTTQADKDMRQQGMDWIEIFTGLLVAVGFLQLCALIGQVVIYCRQAKIMARQAHEAKRQRGFMRLQWKAMRGQLEAQMEALRPRLTITFGENPFRAISNGAIPRIVPKVINTGGTPAYSVTPESWIDFLPMPFVDFTADAIYFKGQTFPVYPTQPVFYPVQLKRFLTPDEQRNMTVGRYSLCLRIRLSYAVFGETKYC